MFSHYQPVPVLDSLQARSPGVASEVLRRRMLQGQHQDPWLLDHRAAFQVNPLQTRRESAPPVVRIFIANNMPAQ